jgi:hypothetical protein
LAKLFQRRRLKYEKVDGRTTDAKWWQYLTWPFGSGELKNDEKRAITPRRVKLVQLVKIYMPSNFEVNLITRLGVIALFSSFFSSPDPKGHVRYCHHLASVVRPLTFSYFNLLLWNNLAKWNQSWQ